MSAFFNDGMWIVVPVIGRGNFRIFNACTQTSVLDLFPSLTLPLDQPKAKFCRFRFSDKQTFTLHQLPHFCAVWRLNDAQRSFGLDLGLGPYRLSLHSLHTMTADQ